MNERSARLLERGCSVASVRWASSGTRSLAFLTAESGVVKAITSVLMIRAARATTSVAQRDAASRTEPYRGRSAEGGRRPRAEAQQRFESVDWGQASEQQEKQTTRGRDGAQQEAGQEEEPEQSRRSNEGAREQTAIAARRGDNETRSASRRPRERGHAYCPLNSAIVSIVIGTHILPSSTAFEWYATPCGPSPPMPTP